MRLTDRVGASLVEPRAALAEVEQGRGGLPDAVLLLLLKVVCTETPLLVATIWSMVVVGPAVALGALVNRISTIIGADLLLLVAGGAVVTLLAGKRRSPARDFDLAAVAWTPVLAVDTIATLAARAVGIELPAGVAEGLWLVALGWMGIGLAFAIGTARARGATVEVPVTGGSAERAAGIVLACALAALLGLNLTAILRGQRSVRPQGDGDPAPALALLPIDPGGPKALADLRGQVVLLDFWATWCGPCRQSMPAVQRLYDRFHAAGLAVVSVNVEGDAARAQSFAAHFAPALTFPLYLDDGRASAAFHVDSIPELVLVDRQGTIRMVHVGGFDEDEMAERIQRLLR